MAALELEVYDSPRAWYVELPIGVGLLDGCATPLDGCVTGLFCNCGRIDTRAL